MKREYITVKIPKPTLKDLVTLGQGIYILMILLSMFGALSLLLVMMIEIFFKVKLL